MLEIMKMVLVVVLVALPLVSVGGRGAGLETGGFYGTGHHVNGHGV